MCSASTCVIIASPLLSPSATSSPVSVTDIGICCDSLHFSLISARHVAWAAFSDFLLPLMRSPAFPALCDALYFLFRLNTALRHSLGLGITPQQVTINPTRFCNLPYMDTLLSSLNNPIVLLPCCFPSWCAQTICTLFGRNHCRAHGPCSKCIYSSTCTLPSPHFNLLSLRTK